MPRLDCFVCLLAALLMVSSAGALAREGDRQQPLLVNADATDGTLGDGKAILSGSVEINQGSLRVHAARAEVEKVDGRVRSVILTGNPVKLQQEIEHEGLVTATAREITYQVATGMVTLKGNAEVHHPQYDISGEVLTYDMNLQHFQGSGGNNNGRIRIQLAPELIPRNDDRTDAAPVDKTGATPESQTDVDGPDRKPESASSSGANHAQS